MRNRFLLLILILTQTNCFAAQSTTTFQVTATVTSNCSLSANTLAFGNYNPVSVTALDGSTTIGATCTNGTAYTIGLNQGAGAGASVSARKMTGPSSNVLNYALYTDAGRTTNWDNIGGSNLVSGTATGALQNITIYGRIPALQTVIDGSYADTITVTIDY